MAIKQTSFQDAPSFAKASSTFQRDERCYEVDVIVGDVYDEVYKQTQRAFWDIPNPHGKVTDYDVNWSREGEKWVGVTCIDE